MAAKLTKPTHKIAIQLHLVTESCTVCSSCSRRPVRKLLDTHSYEVFYNCPPSSSRLFVYLGTCITVLPHLSVVSLLRVFAVVPPQLPGCFAHLRVSTTIILPQLAGCLPICEVSVTVLPVFRISNLSCITGYWRSYIVVFLSLCRQMLEYCLHIYTSPLCPYLLTIHERFPSHSNLDNTYSWKSVVKITMIVFVSVHQFTSVSNPSDARFEVFLAVKAEFMTFSGFPTTHYTAQQSRKSRILIQVSLLTFHCHLTLNILLDAISLNNPSTQILDTKPVSVRCFQLPQCH